MKSYYCKRLYEEINFDADKIYVCCGNRLGPSFYIPNLSEDSNYYKKLFSWRKKCTKNAYLGHITEECKNCNMLEERQISHWEYLKVKLGIKAPFKLKNIIVKSYRQCEYSCVYCLEHRFTQRNKTLELSKSEFYDFVPVLKGLIKENLIDKEEVRLEIQGGSISVWDEFLDVIKIANNFGIRNFMYHTNAFKYIPEIVEIAQQANSSMSISIDSGCRETYKIIKGNSDYFEQVIENIIKYANAGIQISLKYIIVKNLNDNIEELSNFFNVLSYIRSKLVEKNKGKVQPMLEIDFRESLSSLDYQIPPKYLELYRYAIEHCKKNDFSFGCQDFIRKLLETSKIWLGV